ncbi:MAG: hypothetical protein JXR31_02775 [Prolixibacteraceae bacterium]|nr:hypothetical protein [Prolixibacteraceae bacterium]MBN2773146.1 hypothetical protein [Prolixibacteraceae bacterium]
MLLITTKQTKYEYPSLTGWKNQAQDIYGIQFLPQNVLVVNGIITAKDLNKEQLEKKLAEIFRK